MSVHQLNYGEEGFSGEQRMIIAVPPARQRFPGAGKPPGFFRRIVVFADDANSRQFPPNPRLCIRLQQCYPLLHA